MNSQISQLRTALIIQSAHLVLSAVWNIYGVQRIAAGLAAPGPIASYQVAAMLLLFMLLLWLGAKHFKPLYILCTLLIMAAVSQSIYTAFTGAADLWPSSAWRWSGASLNSLAIIGGVIGLTLSLFKQANTEN